MRIQIFRSGAPCQHNAELCAAQRLGDSAVLIADRLVAENLDRERGNKITLTRSKTHAVVNHEYRVDTCIECQCRIIAFCIGHQRLYRITGRLLYTDI